ncbi:MAG: polysaccharide deacetylase family protein [Muribaculaceae bacterium]|nr:polysaccharide deacetylase family protein [Muribaculaceae bacterium]
MRKLLIALGAALIFLTGYSFADNDTARERGHAVALDAHHVVVGCDTDSMVVRLVFSADSMFEGGEYAVGVLDSMHVPASFFFTGNFLRMKEYEPLIRRIVADGHYVGTHSNHHLLLADWDGKRTPLITPDSMLADLDSNYLELARFGVKRADAPYALPPFEWCHRTHADAYRSAGITPVNPSPGVETYRDYTAEGMPGYRTTPEIWDQLWRYEKERGLKGAIIIVHLGVTPLRQDKFYRLLPQMIDTLRARGYRLERF